MRISHFLSLFLLPFLLVDAHRGASSTGDRVLIVLDAGQDKQVYNSFFSSLTRRGYELSFSNEKPNTNETLLVDDADEPIWDHVVLLGLPKFLTPQSLYKILTHPTKPSNLLISLSSLPKSKEGAKQNTILSSFAAEFGLVIPPQGSQLVSYFPERKPPHSVIPVSSAISIPSEKTKKQVMFSGLAFHLPQNPLVFSILSAPAESFVADPSDSVGGKPNADVLAESAEKGGEGLWAGSKLSLVAGFQSNPALAGSGTLSSVVQGRVVFVGGDAIFLDEYAKENGWFVDAIASWCFQETGTLRIRDPRHSLVNSSTFTSTYTTNDQVTFQTVIEAWSPSQKQWIAPKPALSDVQLEFVMLDPHLRVPLTEKKGKAGVYETSFRVPDRHGVFKFRVDYRRPGLTFLHSSQTVSVVPPRHDGYPRFLSPAWVYYVGTGSVVVGWVIFVSVWLVSSDAPRAKGAKKE